jgi:hypothetical protein
MWVFDERVAKKVDEQNCIREGYIVLLYKNIGIFDLLNQGK